MKVILNGEPLDLALNVTVNDVLEKIGAANKTVATVVNEELVRSNDRANRRLQEGDRIEILNFAGGG
ncbi:MAG TPA: thiamine biosynthesis protein ThiS [Verrucomicrobia bacterium]|nr:MAG: thiamine biosynthesis protein ThiS [Lentisphaerae bacterium GWF2_57_35]HBA85153.1 thiamine biosynthesis protein ThiS [Verrucomicrobiota bacterium]